MEINILNEETIDKIAAGEVVERPCSVVKELVENSIDAGATAVTIEIKEGGISFIRITDNGAGIDSDQVKKAFFRHATSKLNDASDLSYVSTLGFRGEALSSIAAVSQVEMLTKTKDALTGVRYVIEGAREISFEEVGVPDGTTIIIRNIFYNTPVRKKFLKSPSTEGSYIYETCEKIALSKPHISFQFIMNGQVKFQTSGNGDLKELVYRIYGRETASELIPVYQKGKLITISGVLGKPVTTRSNRNFENFFVNGRLVQNKMISSAVEDGYESYLMQHKFPFCILNFDMDTRLVDINVHPNKMEVRFVNGEDFFDYISSTVSTVLKMQELIPDTTLFENKEEKVKIERAPEPFEVQRMHQSETAASVPKEQYMEVHSSNVITSMDVKEPRSSRSNVIKADQTVVIEKPEQISLFEPAFLSEEAELNIEIIGQVFDTYWIFTYGEKLFLMDQHAAHEKVKYEHLVSQLRDQSVVSQTLNPPIVVTLQNREKEILNSYLSYFENLGFTIEDFGSQDIAVRSVPVDLYGHDEKELFLSLLDELCDEVPRGKQEVIYEKLASMACKSAVKGNHSMSKEEAAALLKEMMTLDNPYNCPHGRPTMISLTKKELEKKFKRIV